MIKTCKLCGASFTTHDSRRKGCGKICGDKLRSLSQKTENTLKGSGILSLSGPPPEAFPLKVNQTVQFDMSKLPPPEMLPAAYVKRVHDLWVALVGDKDTTARIA